MSYDIKFVGGFKNALCDAGFPCKLTIPSILRRLKQGKTDAWKDYFAVRQSISRKAAKFFE